MTYATTTNLDLVFGIENLNRWADLDNNKNPNTIAERKEWALETAEDYINGRFAQSKYLVPFSDCPKLIKHLTCLYAGILLYDGRGQNATEKARDQVSRQRKEFDRLLRQILSGQVTLIGGLSGDPLEFTSETTPFVDADTEETGCSCSPLCNCAPIEYIGDRS